MPLSKASRNKVRQTRLSIAPIPSSSPSQGHNPQAVQHRLANMPYDDAPDKHTSAEVDPVLLPTPEPSSQLERDRQESSSSPLSEPPSSVDFTQPTDAADDREDDDLPVRSSKRRKLRQWRRDSTPAEITPTRKSTRLEDQSNDVPSDRITSSQASKHSTRQFVARDLSDLGSPETSGDEGDKFATKPSSTRRKTTKPADDFVVDDDDVEYVSSDEPRSRRRTSKRRRPAQDDFVVNDDEIELVTSDEAEGQNKAGKEVQRRRLLKTPRRRSHREQAELDDELADLQDSDTPQKQSRTRGGPVTTQRDKTREYFERLRLRRAGKPVPRVEDSDNQGEESEEEGADLDRIGVEPDILEISDQDSNDSSSDTTPGTTKGYEDEEDDFIEDDSSSKRHLPHPDIPLEFTSFASAKPRELFPYIVEWLVKNKIAPAFSRHDQLYQLAFDRLDDQVKAQAGSRLISSSWGETFKHAILARPKMTVSHVGFDIEMLTCDACNRTNHPATYEFVLTGQAYDKDSLEPIENDSDNEDDHEESDRVSRDAANHPLAPQSTHFYLGRFCAANAEMGHKLTHWKYQLNQHLLSYLEEQGVLSAQAILQRERMNKKKREREAERIVDDMQESGMVDRLWQEFKGDLDDARIGMEDYERKGRRGKNRVGTVESAGSFVWG